MNTNLSSGPFPAHRLAYVGIDNGFTGAVACLTHDNRLSCRPVRFNDLGEERFLDADGNLAILSQMLAEAGVPKERALVVFEHTQASPTFGARNNFTNGKNREFWRVLLTREKFPFTWVTPKKWQAHVFAGMPGLRSKKKKTKAIASMVRKQLFPELNLSDYTADQIEGINDAILIAVWARENHR